MGTTSGGVGGPAPVGQQDPDLQGPGARLVGTEKTVDGALVHRLLAADGQSKLDPAGVDGSPDHCDDHVVAAATTRVIGSTAGRTLDTDPKADRRARHHPDSTGRFMPARFNYWAGQLAPPKPSTMQ